MNLEQTVKELQDTLIVVGAIQSKQASVQKLQAEELDALRTVIREGLAAHDQRMRDLDERIANLVSGFGEFLRQMREDRR